MRRILFVDDEPQVLDGLRDALRSRRHAWDMVFADSGERALAELSGAHYDVVISDMRMPGMDGATLLGHVRAQQPDTIRIILSGYADAQLVVDASPSAHRFLAKPCDVGELTAVIERSCALLDYSRRGPLRAAALGARGLPSLPRLFTELGRLLEDPEAGPREAAAVVGGDTAMTGKVLQLVNSGFFGLTRHVSRLEEAIAYVGLGTLRALTLSTHVMDAFPARTRIDGFSLDDVQRRCCAVAGVVAKILPAGPARDDAVAAALLHDIGIVVLASEDPEYLGLLVSTAHERGCRPVALEHDLGGASHAELGGHLLSLWNLPQPIVEAVTHHHRPRAAGDPVPLAVAALHVAEALTRDPGVELPWRQFDGGEPWPDAGELQRLGLAERLPAARRAAAEAAAAAPES
jgi:HD-like signal output (HDOD) protein/ActR/RegA family two-component response regulator